MRLHMLFLFLSFVPFYLHVKSYFLLHTKSKGKSAVFKKQYCGMFILLLRRKQWSPRLVRHFVFSFERLKLFGSYIPGLRLIVSHPFCVFTHQRMRSQTVFPGICSPVCLLGLC